MSDRPTPETDAAAWVETNQANALVLASFARNLERQRDEALELARELRDAFERFYGFPNCSRARLLAQSALTKAKEVLP
jgi:hypothetical protein